MGENTKKPKTSMKFYIWMAVILLGSASLILGYGEYVQYRERKIAQARRESVEAFLAVTEGEVVVKDVTYEYATPGHLEQALEVHLAAKLDEEALLSYGNKVTAYVYALCDTAGESEKEGPRISIYMDDNDDGIADWLYCKEEWRGMEAGETYIRGCDVSEEDLVSASIAEETEETEAIDETEAASLETSYLEVTEEVTVEETEVEKIDWAYQLGDAVVINLGLTHSGMNDADPGRGEVKWHRIMKDLVRSTRSDYVLFDISIWIVPYSEEAEEEAIQQMLDMGLEYVEYSGYVGVVSGRALQEFEPLPLCGYEITWNDIGLPDE